VKSVVIEKAREEHLASIPGVELAGSALFSEADLPPHIRYKVTDKADLREALRDNRLWVALDRQQKIIGYAMADVVDNQAYLTEVDVLPDFGRRGIGTRLVNAVVEWAGTSEFASLSLVTFRHVPWNAPFYEKLGFSIVESSEYGPELRGFIEDEGRVGIDIANRVAMKLSL